MDIDIFNEIRWLGKFCRAFIFAASLLSSNLSYPQKIIKIMPMGDSFTSGRSGSDYVGRSGYRQPLYDSLVNYGYKPSINEPSRLVDFNFVGSVIQPARIPSVIDTFDVESEGHSGWEAGNSEKPAISLVDHVKSFIEKNTPDIILLHIGTNDITDLDSPRNIEQHVSSILDSIYNYNSNIIVILAKIANRVGGSSLTTEYNNELNAMYERRKNQGDRLFLVDMENGAGINYSIDSLYPFNEGKDMKDTIHPNDTGFRKMASVWFNKLQEIFTPAISSPEDKSTIVSDSINFKWEKSLVSSSYRLQISGDSLFSNILYDQADISDTFKVIGSLEKNSTYYWRVSSKINSDYGPFSGTRSFTTKTINAVENSKDYLDKFSLEQNYPNPFNSQTRIRYQVPGAEGGAFVSLKLYDILGREVSTLVNERKSAGIYEIDFNADNTLGSSSSNVYFYRLVIGNYSETKKMMLIK